MVVGRINNSEVRNLLGFRSGQKKSGRINEVVVRRGSTIIVSKKSRQILVEISLETRDALAYLKYSTVDSQARLQNFHLHCC